MARKMTVRFEAARALGAICAVFCAWRDHTATSEMAHAYDMWERDSWRLVVDDVDMYAHDSWEI